MQWSDISLRPPARTLRRFACLWLVFFGGVACWQWFGRGNELWAGIVGLVAVAVGLPGLLVPKLVQPIYVASMVVAFPIGWTISRFVLMCVFYGLFTPLGLVFRLMGRDALRLRRPSNGETHWLPKPAATSSHRYFQQF
jgi:hypothetical protein